jgi:acetyl-CoA carboxylase biotin carboxyl carrier protein
MATVKPEDIEALVEVFDGSDWNELRVTMGGLDIFLSKDGSARHRSPGPPAPAPATPVPAATVHVAAAPAAAAPAGDKPKAAAIPDGRTAIRAPNLGTFYKSPKPGAPAFVEVGQKVGPETEICIIEVMKLFTTVRAGQSGVVREVLVADGQMVEFDQPLFLIEPTA